MNRVVALAALALIACESKAPMAPPPPAVPATDAAEPVAVVPARFTPPPDRIPLLKQFLQKNVAGRSPVGTYVDAELAQPVPLQAVGLNHCQNGYVLQGYLLRDGAVVATPPLPIRYATLPTGPAASHHPAVEGQTLRLDLTTATLSSLSGTVSVMADAEQKPLMMMSINDATPISILTGPGLGAQGCFTTGSYELSAGGATVTGPVSAVFDGKRLYYVGARLTEKHGIGMWFHLEPTHRQPQNVLRGDLATIADKPRRFPFRVVFETRKTTPRGVVVEETPAPGGSIVASWKTPNAEGPLRVELSGLVFPDWDGPMSGEEASQVRVEASFVTDLGGSRVPLPPQK